MIAYTLFTLIRGMFRRKYILPANRKEWGSLSSDILTIFACLFLLFILNKNFQDPMRSVLAYKGKELPAFSFFNIKNGREESLKDYQKKIVILNIWATWCAPCRREMPDLNKVFVEKQKDGIEVIAISDEDPATVKKFLSEHPYQFNTSYFTSSNALINSIQTRPVSILIVNGLVKDIVIGSRGYGFFSDWVK